MWWKKVTYIKASGRETFGLTVKRYNNEQHQQQQKYSL